MKTLIDVDPKLIAAAAKALGTTTGKATVQAALEAAVRQKKEREELRKRLRNSAGGRDIANERLMEKAW